ncbi:kinase-like domain-containing protein [Parasitella parasitica]|nr:kinase-like domain-containing protein [Parasitella parasitica]
MTHLGSPHDAYDFIEQIGDGSFGTVHKAQNKISHKIVAVKVMKKKYKTIEDCQGQFEPKLLHLIPAHINIVQLYDSFLSPTTCDLSFVMEYMDSGNLYQLMRERRHHNLPFNHCELKNMLHQILSAVSHIHSHQVFHRDMKPENLLLDYSTGRPIIKLADFGLARELKSQPPYTEYVSTRWYRAPEVLLRSTEYSAPVDLWAVGTIFAELITLEPLFPGESEIDQIYRICEILGSPGNKIIGQKSKRMQPEKRLSPGFARKKTKDLNTDLRTINTSTNSTISILDGGGEWKEGVRLAYKIGFKFPQLSPKPLESVIPNATESMLDLIRHFLFFNPCQRWSADTALRHAFFSETDGPVHAIVPVNHSEPITPPDNTAKKIFKDITPLDLLPIPQSPYQICPDWNTDHPVSRHGRLCSALKDDNRLSNSCTTHVDRFLHDPESVDNNAWLTQSRPIYSSHQKVHPVTDRPSSSHVWNKYNYAAHQQLRPSTPVVEHVSASNNVIPSASTSASKRHPNVSEEDPHRRFGHHLHHHLHHPHHNDYHNHNHNHNHHHHPRPPTTSTVTATTATCTSNSGFSIDRIPHYGNQLIKWAPPPYQIDHDHEITDPKRPESRRCRSPAPFSPSIVKHKYAPATNNSINPSCTYSNTTSIKPWTPATTSTTINTDKIMAESYARVSDKPQSTNRNSTSQRFNLWVPSNDEDEDQKQDDCPEDNNKRSVFSPLHLN